MASVMPPQGLGLSVHPNPTRQDIISELLDDYAYSRDNGSASGSPSPVSISKELPPPPPFQTTSPRDRKREAIERMNTKFQLRELDSATASDVAPTGSPEQQSHRRIVSRSLSRSGAPPSLKLSVSNGSTAALPAVPVDISPVKPAPSSLPRPTKALPPPPPPPARSNRRPIAAESTAMGQHESKTRANLDRNDSFHSQKDGERTENKSPDAKIVAPPVQRKALPGAGGKKFASLLELNNGPRGSKIKPPAPTSAPRELGVDKNVKVPTVQPARKESLPNNQLPPTPPEEKSAPLPPRKAVIGLPSNPRARSPVSPLHVRGKSSTGFFLKTDNPVLPPPAPQQVPNRDVTTPEMTPSLALKPMVRRDNEISPVTPLPPPTDQHRPFSYEGSAPQARNVPAQAVPTQSVPTQAVPTQVVPTQAVPTQAVPAPQALATVVSQTQADSVPQVQASIPQAHAVPEVQVQAPPETQTQPASEPAKQAVLTPKTQEEKPQAATPTQSVVVNASSPALGLPSPTPSSGSPTTNTPPGDEDLDELPPFTPLTRRPYVHAAPQIPEITSANLNCYTSHANLVWSNNRFQALGCMICQSNATDRKWSCAWCQLRTCRACTDDLWRTPGHDLGELLRRREQVENSDAPEIRVEGTEDEDAKKNGKASEDGDEDEWGDEIAAEYMQQERLERMSSIEEETEDRGAQTQGTEDRRRTKEVEQLDAVEERGRSELRT